MPVDSTTHQTHADVMDRLYAWQINIYDFTRKYYLLDRDFLITHLAPPKHGHVIEIGCGTGRNLIKAAKLYPDTYFTGLDISSVMLAKANQAIRKASLEDRIQLIQADASNLDFSNPALAPLSFDRVFCSYTLSMVPDWNNALLQIVQLVKKNGSLTIVDFGQMQEMPHFFKIVLRQWLKLFHTTPRDGLTEGIQQIAPFGFDIEINHPHFGYSIFIKAEKN
jgi:S-adenosylmethionine-diacylgycerolhomoserine-N-methlytransferase